ncbi:hypothetical protein [Candidatus Amoebophilus asiaticus]|nr:hypothetical protein [Candidatus Amoebophilus asiaticus]
MVDWINKQPSKLQYVAAFKGRRIKVKLNSSTLIINRLIEKAIDT